MNRYSISRIVIYGLTYIWSDVRPVYQILANFASDVPYNWLLNEESYLFVNNFEIQHIMKRYLITITALCCTAITLLISTVEPLYRIQGCRWFQSGVKLIESGDNLIRIDFSQVGNNERSCDSWILRTVNDEEGEAINLRKKR